VVAIQLLGPAVEVNISEFALSHMSGWVVREGLEKAVRIA
jgi:hypothetical protein